MKNLRLKVCLALLLFLFSYNNQALAQISITSTGVPMTEDFNTLVSTSTSTAVPANWHMLESGSGANAVYTASTGTTTAGDTYSFGASGNPERAWGGVNSTSVDTVRVGASYTNNTGGTITSLTIAYTGEQWRKATNRTNADSIMFSYSTNATSLATNSGSWTYVPQLYFITPSANYGVGVSAGALDGNLSANRQAISFTITGLSIANGQTFWIRWFDYNVAGTDDGMAIDDVSVTACAGAPTSTINGSAVICSGSGTNLSVTYSGGQPWSFTWTDGTTPTTVTGITQTPYSFSVTPAATTTYTISSVSGPCGAASLTSNQAVVQVISVPASISISGNQTICNGGSTQLTVNLTGVPSWSFTYTDGTNPATLTGITGSPSLITVNPTSTTTYTLTAVNDFCGAGTISGSGISVITVDPVSAPSATLSGTQSVCAGNTAVLSIALTNGPVWNISYSDGTNTSNVTGLTSNPYLINLTPSASATYSLLSVSNQSCQGNSSGNAVITYNLLPTASISAVSSICAGNTTQLTFNLTGTNPWSLTYTDGTNPVTLTGITSTPHLVSLTPAATTTYTLTQISDISCSQTLNSSAVIQHYAVPSANLSASQSLCAGNSVQISFTLTGTQPWNISYSDGTNTINQTGITSSPYLLDITPSASRTYSGISVSDLHCSSTFTGNSVITVYSVPTASLTGIQPVCAGGSAQLSFNLTGTSPWNLSYSEGTTPVTVTGITSSPYVLSITPANTTTYTLNTIQDLHCSQNLSTSAVLQVIQIPTANLSGSQTLCSGNTAQLSFALTGDQPWSLQYTDGTNTLSPTGITQSPYLVNITPMASISYTLQSVSNGCTGTLGSTTANLMVNTTPSATLSGGASLCSGTSSVLTIDLLSTSNPYNINYSDGNNTITITGITSDPYLISVSPAAHTTYTLTSISDGSGCTGNVAGTAVFNVTQSPSGSLAGNQSICIGSAAQISIQLNGAQPWTIDYTNGTTPVSVSGISSSPYLINLTPSSSQTFTLTGVNNGCSGTLGTTSAIVQVNVPPSASISGTTAICSGTGTIISVDLLTSIFPYDLSYSDGSTTTTVTGISSTPYTFSVSPAANVTYTLLSVDDAGGCLGNVAGNAIITVNPSPTATLSGTQTICAGSVASLTLNLTGTQPWDVVYTNSSANINLTGISTSTYILNVTPSAHTTYSLVSLAAGICPGIVNGTAEITVNAVPTPTISGSNTLSISGVTGPATYQWQMNNTDIAGETSATYSPIANGTYSVRVTQNGCTGTSNALLVIIQSLEELSENTFRIYPNPSEALFHINSMAEIQSVSITDIKGKLILSEMNIRRSEYIIDLSNFPSGMYYLQFETLKGSGRKMLIRK